VRENSTCFVRFVQLGTLEGRGGGQEERLRFRLKFRLEVKVKVEWVDNSAPRTQDSALWRKVGGEKKDQG